jgi:hypothetical protein
MTPKAAPCASSTRPSAAVRKLERPDDDSTERTDALDRDIERQHGEEEEPVGQ